jgi:hypothetical protein
LLAAVETALVECGQLGATQIVVSPGVPDHVLERMNGIEGAPFVRLDGVRPDDVRRGYVVVGQPPDASMREQDFSCDIVAVMERFPAFG